METTRKTYKLNIDIESHGNIELNQKDIKKIESLFRGNPLIGVYRSNQHENSVCVYTNNLSGYAIQKFDLNKNKGEIMETTKEYKETLEKIEKKKEQIKECKKLKECVRGFNFFINEQDERLRKELKDLEKEKYNNLSLKEKNIYDIKKNLKKAKQDLFNYENETWYENEFYEKELNKKIERLEKQLKDEGGIKLKTETAKLQNKIEELVALRTDAYEKLDIASKEHRKINNEIGKLVAIKNGEKI